MKLYFVGWFFCSVTLRAAGNGDHWTALATITTGLLVAWLGSRRK